MTVSLDQIININITRATRMVSVRNFGEPMLVGYHTAFADRVREYSDPSEMLSDGIPSKNPLYKQAVKLCSAENRPATFKVGRRVGAPTQSIRLTPAAASAAGELFEVSIGGVLFSYAALITDTGDDVVNALVALMGDVATSIIASGVTSTTGAQDISGTALNGAIGGGPISPPRNAKITLNAHADWDATTAVLTGRDVNGLLQTENFTIPDGGSATLVGTKVFSQITNLHIPAQSGTGGTLTMGTGHVFANADLALVATDGADHLDVAVGGAGAWFAFSDRTPNISIEDRTSMPSTTLATDLDAIQGADADWYFLLIADAQSSAQITGGAAWVETKKVLYAAESMDSAIEADVTSDVSSTLRAAGYFRTWVNYSRDVQVGFNGAALVGEHAPRTVGSADVEFKALAGVTADELSTTVITRIIGTAESPQSGKRGVIYVGALPTGTNTPTPITLGGLTAGGEWIDVMQGIDFTAAQLQTLLFNLRLAAPKLFFDDVSIERLRGRVEGELKRLSRAPYNIFVEDSINVQATAAKDVDSAKKAARFYDGIIWNAEVEEAISRMKVGGTVSP